MSRRERQAPRMAQAAPRPAGGPPAPSAASASESATQRLPAWEELFGSISAAEQRELLSLAERQGLLYTHQLPPANNGFKSDPGCQLLTHLLAGRLDQLEPVGPSPVEVSDKELDEAQREAVAKALATPDIFLLQGWPGTGKSRVVAEIITQATNRGERVLLLSPSVAALDRILEWIAPRDAVFAIRCLDAKESLESLPPASRPLTYAERARFLNTQVVAAARREIHDSEQRYLHLRRHEPDWPGLAGLAGRREQLDAEIQVLEERRSRLPLEVEHEAARAENCQATGTFATAVWEERIRSQKVLDGINARLAELQKQIEAGRQELQVVSGELAAMRGLIEAKQKRRWWTWAWWRATLRGYTLERWAEWETRRQQALCSLDALEKETALLRQEREQTDNAYQAERLRIVQAELALRQTGLDRQLEPLRSECLLLQDKWQTAFAALASAIPQPADMTVAALKTAQTDWARGLERAQAQQTLARQWAAHLEKSREAPAGLMADYVNLVAATMTALPADPHFGEQAVNGAAGPIVFDLLVVEEADQVTEAELLNAARRAGRWILVGQPAWEDDKVAERENAPAPPRQNAPLTARHLSPACTPVFHRLWQLLHCDPRSLPYVWSQEKDRFCCRLRPVAPEQRRLLESECVADFPDIELRILTLPQSQPVLAEIVFPSSMTIDLAKQYIFRELQELAVQASNHSLRWLNEPDRLVLSLTERRLAHDRSVTLEPGVRETLGPAILSAHGDGAVATAWQTCCLEFDRASGWQRSRAEQWVQQYLGLRDLGRTVRLDVLHRMESNLADFLTGFFALAAGPAGRWQPDPLGNGNVASVEFVAVPPCSKVSRKGGAGLELNLADPRQRDRLPAEYRDGLPNQGFVNYPEAQAVVRVLAALTKDGELAVGATAAARPVAAVLALYPAQAELIRRMIRRVPSLATAAVAVEVATPTAYRHREAQIVLLSLTRSHTHRAVAFGESPQLLSLALTRARSKLIVFGDAGTLARRGQWEGPLEHLDDLDAGRERKLITHLVCYLDGRGPQPQAFHLRQGSGS